MATDIFGKVREYLLDFREPIVITGGRTWSHVNTLRRVDLYWQGDFEEGEKKDENGFYRYFCNIAKPACDTATKFIDLDTKDIILTSEGADSEYRLFFMQRDLRCFLKKHRFGKFLNEIAVDYPKYGTVVAKQNPDSGKWEKLQIHNLRVEPSAPSLAESRFVVEVHSMSIAEIRNRGWNKEKISELIARDPEVKRFTVFECYEPTETGWTRQIIGDLFVTRKGGTFTRGDESTLTNETQYDPGVVLYTDEVDELPYRELHWEKLPGRWLGRGFMEYLFDNQIRTNEIVNLQAKGLYWTALKLFQTSDETVGRNLLTSVENGDIIKTASGITPVAIEERNLAVFKEEKDFWQTNTDRKTFNFDVARGEAMPSGTTLGGTQIAAGMVASYYQLKREEFGMFIRDLMMETLAHFKDEMRGEHLLCFASNDREIDRIRRAYADAMIRHSILERMTSGGMLPHPTEISAERERVMKGELRVKDLKVKIPSAYYDDVECMLDVIVTGEQLDVGARVTTLQSAIQIIGTNPMILEDPRTRSVFFKMLELLGISSVELGLLDEKIEAIPPKMEAGAENPLGGMMTQGMMPRGAPVAAVRAQTGAQNIPAPVAAVA